MNFDLKAPSTWDQVVSRGLLSVLGPTYLDKVANNAEKIKYRDSEDEGCNLFLDIAPRRQVIARVIKELTSSFTHVFTYHACRPTDISSYYSKGILPLSLAKAQKQFREMFRQYASEEAIETAIAEASTETRDGVVHVVLDDRIFTEDCGHYLIYGGEYQNCLAINLPGASENTRDLLKKSGRATVFVCLLPFSKLKKDLKHLVPLLLADHFFRVAHGRKDVDIIDYTLFMKRKIAPHIIVKHYSPVRIRDPFKHHIVWNDETMEYEY